MSSLLIYNDNITPDFIYKFKNKIGDTIPFSISNQTLSNDEYSFDNVVSDFLLEFSQKKYEVIFIPLNLSFSNYLEFTGLKLGYHIRLTENFINQETSIVFIGEEESFEINKLTIYGEILHSPNIFLTKKMDVIDFTKQIEYIKSIKNDNIISTFLKKIKIEPSGNYATHHSIANEWSILRWSNALNLLNDQDSIPADIETIKNKINNNLYYKYLKCKHPVKKSSTIEKEILKLKFNGKLLFIDDEIEKGWNEIFCNLFWDGDINKIENYESIGGEFKDLNQNEIIELSVDKAKNFDVVILDFRLTDNDFYESDPTKITGFKILEKIKIHNPGIQVIVFSASNKIWNLQALQEAGAQGFIIKESPENSKDSDFAYNSIANIIRTVDICFEMSFLINAYKNLKSINNHCESISNNSNEKGFLKLLKLKLKNEIQIQIQIIYDCLKNTRPNNLNISYSENYLNLSFISIYKILELFNDYYTNDSGTKLKSDNSSILKYDHQNNSFIKSTSPYPSTLDKLFTIIYKELNLDVSIFFNKIIKVNNIRKNIIHPKNIKDYYKASVEENIDFIILVNDLIKKIK
jgi:CheY-like chemotaxis protein